MPRLISSALKSRRFWFVALPFVLGLFIWRLKPPRPVVLSALALRNSMIVTPDGRYVVQNEDAAGQFAVYDTQTDTQAIYPPHPFSEFLDGDRQILLPLPDSHRFLSSKPGPKGYFSIAIYDLATPSKSRVIAPGQIQTPMLACSPRDGTVAGFDLQGRLGFWNNSSGHKTTTWDARVTRMPTPLGKIRLPESMAFSPDGTVLALGGTLEKNSKAETTLYLQRYGGVTLWDVHKGRFLRACQSPTSTQLGSPSGPTTWKGLAVTSLTFSPDGQWLATESDGNGVVIWNVATGKIAHILTHPVPPLTGAYFETSMISWSPDSQLIVAPSCNGFVDVWQTSTGHLAHHFSVYGPVAFLPNGHLLTGSSPGGHLLDWNIG